MNEGGADALADRDVVRLVKRGHLEFFRILVDRYQSRVFSIGMRFLKNREDALDFTQEVFLKAFEAIPGFRGFSGGRAASFAGWLTRIAYRKGINTSQRRKTYLSLAEEYHPGDTGYGPEKEHLRRQITMALAKAADTLSEAQLMCLDLSFFYGLRYSEISDVTGIPENTVKSHVFRAKKLIKEALKGTEAEDYHEL